MKTRELEKPMHFDEVMEFLGMGPDYIYKALQDGRITGYKLGNRWIVYPSDLQRFLNQQYNNRFKIKLAK